MRPKNELQRPKCGQKRTLFLLGLATALLLWIGAILMVPRRVPSRHFAQVISGPFYQDSYARYNGSFFFIETADHERLNARQACAAESAALHHPNNIVNFLMTGEPDVKSTYIDVLRNISNIRIVHVNPEDVFKGTPLESWYQSPARLQSPYVVAHLSDAMRLVLLWRYGGFYLDTDVVVQRSMLGLKNAVGLEDDQNVANGVLVFDRGHPILLDAITRFPKRYKPSEWSTNGPLLLQAVIRDRCPKCMQANNNDSCGCDLHVLPRTAFFAIPYRDWKAMLDPSRTADILPQTQESYLLHFWNYLSSKAQVHIGNGSLYDIAARRDCPNVYRVAQPVGYL